MYKQLVGKHIVLPNKTVVSKIPKGDLMAAAERERLLFDKAEEVYQSFKSDEYRCLFIIAILYYDNLVSYDMKNLASVIYSKVDYGMLNGDFSRIDRFSAVYMKEADLTARVYDGLTEGESRENFVRISKALHYAGRMKDFDRHEYYPRELNFIDDGKDFITINP